MQDCVICTERLLTASKEPAALACGHMFHGECIRQWFANKAPDKKQCPTCKQTAAKAMSNNGGIIRLYLDTSAPSPGAGALGGGSSMVPADVETSDASGEVALLKHGLLYAQRELLDQKRQMVDIQKRSRGVQEALREETEKADALRTQLQSALSSVRKAQADTRSRDNEIERLKSQMALEKEEVARARSLQAASDALELEKEVDHLYGTKFTLVQLEPDKTGVDPVTSSECAG